MKNLFGTFSPHTMTVNTGAAWDNNIDGSMAAIHKGGGAHLMIDSTDFAGASRTIATY